MCAIRHRGSERDGDASGRQRGGEPLNDERQVVVTGIGAITPIGSGTGRSLYEGVRRERSAITRVTRFDPSPYSSQVAGEVADFDPAAYIEPRRLRRLDRYAQMAVVCARLAIDDAGLRLED